MKKEIYYLNNQVDPVLITWLFRFDGEGYSTKHLRKLIDLYYFEN